MSEAMIGIKCSICEGEVLGSACFECSSRWLVERDEARADRDECLARMKEARKERLVAINVARELLKSAYGMDDKASWLECYPWLKGDD
jgi:hypothetical protein